jgi:hypothetical protein
MIFDFAKAQFVEARGSRALLKAELKDGTLQLSANST